MSPSRWEASGTSLVDIYGVDPVVAGILIGYSGDMLNHALHLIAICQLRHTNTEGKTKKEAIRALKRRLSGVVFRNLQADQHTC